MADPNAPAAPDPFAHFDVAPPPQAVAPDPAPPPDAAAAPAVANDNGSPAAPSDGSDPFAHFDVGPAPSSATGAFVRGAEKSALPAGGALAGAGAGAELGAGLGTLVGPGYGTVIGGAVGGLAGGIAGAKAVQTAQNWAVNKLPDSWKDAIGFGDRQAEQDEKQHAGASFMGGLVPYAVTMSPSLAFKGAASALPENATALQRILAHPATGKLFGGALMGGMEAGNEKMSDEDLSWRKVAVATVFGTIFNRPNGIGEAITELGAHPTRTVLGRPHPTLAQAADLKVLGPGVTESVFQGTQEQAPQAALTAQENARVEQSSLGEPPEPDVHAVARQMEPELFSKYDDLLKRREIFAEHEVDGQTIPALAAHLAATNAEIESLGPEVASAYRRAADTTGTGSVEAEKFGSFAEMLAARENQTGAGHEAQTQNIPQPAGEPIVPAGGEEGPHVEGPAAAPGAVLPRPVRTIGDQRAFIASDVSQKLIAAGRPEEEARAAGQLIAARYVTRAGRFAGKLGTPEELYAREGAAIAGPNGQALRPASASSAGVATGSDITLPISGPGDHLPSRQTTALAPPEGVFSKRTIAPSQDLASNSVDMGLPSGRRVYHALNNVAELEKVASESKPDLDNFLSHAVDGIDGAEVYGSRAKERSSVESKFTHQGREPNQVSDWLGGRIMVDNWQAMTDVLARMKQNGDVRIVDDFMNEAKGGGYRAVHVQVMGRNGLSAEVQIQPREMTVAGEEAHNIYAKWRRREISAEDLPQAEADEAASRKLYEDAWSAFKSHAGERPETQTETQTQTHAEPVQAALEASDRINELSPAEQKRALPAYSPAAETAPKGPDQPAGVFMFDPTQLNVDAQRFQFKSGGDEYGVTGALRNVTKWDPAKAQAIIVWEQNDGKLYVADGHQRAGLARRLTEQGGAKNIELPGILYREKDGISSDDIRAMAAVTNIANGSGSAIDGAKVLRARPDLMDGSLPLSTGKGKQAASLARLGDEPFRMVVNDVVPEHYGAIVGELIPHDPARQEAAIKAIARFEPKNADEAAVLTQRVAQAELAKAEAGSQTSMFGDLETAESTAGEEMKIVGRAIADLKKDKSLFARVLANAERIEATGSQIERGAAQSVTSDSELFAKTLASDAYSAGPLRDELKNAARDLKNGKSTVTESSARIIAALRSQAETHGADRAGDLGSREPQALELAQSKEGFFEPGAEGKPQALIPGVEPVTQRDLIQQAAAKPLAPKVAQKPAGGLFGDSMDQKELFQVAYHGSPYHFDMFDTGKIGSGEGAQAYGHGLYFAENENVAKAYKDALAVSKEGMTIAGEPGKHMNDMKGAERQAYVMAANDRGNLDRSIERAGGAMNPEEVRAVLQRWKDTGGVHFPSGNLYRVDIKPEPHKFLQWDRPLKEQSQKIQDAVYDALKRSGQTDAMAAHAVNNYTGERAYKMLARATYAARNAEGKLRPLDAKNLADARRQVGDGEAVQTNINPDPVEGSKILKDIGVPGIRYLDQGSRDAAEGTHNYVVFDPKDIQILDRNGKQVSEAEYNQTARGKIRIAPDARPIITLMKDANASTFVHESGHQFLEELMHDADHPEAPQDLRADASTVKDWLGVESASDIKTKHHEKFARGFEQYLREGVAPSKELAGVFAKFRNWLLSIYQSIKGLGTEISPEIRSVFDRMLEMEPQRTIITPHERPAGGPLLHEIHTADAAHTEPHEAAAVFDRTKAEFDRYVAEPPKDVALEVAPALQKAEAEQAARAGSAAGTEPAGEAAGGAGPAPEVVPGGGRSVSVPASGGVGQRGGELGGSAGQPAAEGDGVSGVDRRAQLGSHAGTALAPGPADLFGAKQSPFTDRAGNIRVENLTTREDVAQAIRDSAAENSDFIGDRRGTITDGQVLELADALGMDAAQLNQRQLGQAFNAEQIMAARKLLIQSATTVSAAMKKAATGTDEDVMAYAQAKDRHQLIQAQVAGITAEAGRALRAFRSIAGQESAQATDQFIKQATGKTLFQLRAEAKLGAELQTPQQVSKFMQDADKHNFSRIVLEYWINGLISGPATHATYMVGNTLSAIMKVPESIASAAAARAASALGRKGTGVHGGEAGALVRGFGRGIAPAIKAGIEAARTGITTQLPGEGPGQAPLPFQPGAELGQGAQFDEHATFHDAMASAFGLVRGMRDTVTSTAALLAAGGVPGEGGFSRVYSPTRATPNIAFRGVTVLPTGDIATLPSRGVAVIHSFFRSLVFSMEKNAMAYRQAANEGLSGNELHARVAELRQDPSQDMMNQAAAHEATETALMGKGSELTQRLAALTNTRIFGAPLLKFIDPFVRVSGNIIDQSLIRRTPVGLLTMLGPETELARDLTGKNGNVAQDKAIGRMMMGTAIAVTFGSLAAQKMLSGSGPKDPKEANIWRMAGNQAHSVRIGDTWYQVNKLGPVGMLASLSADLYDVAHEAEEGDFTKAGAHLLHAITQNVLDESAMHGPAELLKAIETPDRYGESYIRNYLAAFVPYSVGLGQIARGADPWQRDTRTMIDTIRNKIPEHLDSYFGNELPVRRDIWGEPLPSRTALGGAGISAIYEQSITNDPVNQAMYKVGVFPGAVERKIHNVDLTPDQYDDFQRLAGRMAKMRLDKMVLSPQFRQQTPSVQHDWMTEVIKQSRESARQMVMIKNPQIIRQSLEAKQVKKQAINDRNVE